MHTFDERSTEKTFQLKTMDFTRIPSTTWVCLLLVLNTWSYSSSTTATSTTATMESITTSITEATTTSTTASTTASTTTSTTTSTTASTTTSTTTAATSLNWTSTTGKTNTAAPSQGGASSSPPSTTSSPATSTSPSLTTNVDSITTSPSTTSKTTTVNMSSTTPTAPITTTNTTANVDSITTSPSTTPKTTTVNMSSTTPTAPITTTNTTDINECNDNHTCHLDADCHNTNGSYNCTCKKGYTGNGTTCTDINECNDNHTCHLDADCHNTNGSYNCTCKKGYTGNGTTCTDINECNDNHTCHLDADCHNTNGSYNCTCKKGYSGNGTTCTDINECNDNHTCHLDADCHNTNGSYNCTCKKGYTGNGTTCTDINECNDNHTCHLDADCHNTNGSYNCTCKKGYTGNGTTCTDINECNDNHTCHLDADCHNTNGSYNCTCKKGYTGNGTTCTDVDECVNMTLCDYSQYCVNTNGTYSCKCKPGYYRDDDLRICIPARFSYVGYVTIIPKAPGASRTNLTKSLHEWLTTIFKNFTGFTYVEILANDTSYINRRRRRDAEMKLTYIVYLNVSGTSDELQHLITEHFLICGNVCNLSLFSVNNGSIGMGSDFDLCNIKGDCDPVSTNCTAASGRYDCACKTGFKRKTNPFSAKFCIDIDECNNQMCKEGETCVNFPGTWACCTNGFVANHSTKQCRDMCQPNPCMNEATCVHGNKPGLFYCKCKLGWKGHDCTEADSVASSESNSEASTFRTILIAVGASLGSICLLLLIVICRVCRRKQSQKHQDRRPLSTQMNDFEMDDKKGYYQIPRPHVNNESERQYDVIEVKSELNVLDEARSSKQDKLESRQLTEFNNEKQDGVENRSFLHEEAARRNKEKPGRNSIEYF